MTPCIEGYAIVETEYDTAGGVMCTKYYGADGKLINAPGKEYAYIRTIPFKDLKVVEETEEAENEGEDNEEEPDTEETEAVTSDETDDGDGSIVEYHGTDGKLMNLASGYAYIVREKNELGYVYRESYYNAAGEAVTIPAGYAVIKKNTQKQETCWRKAISV